MSALLRVMVAIFVTLSIGYTAIAAEFKSSMQNYAASIPNDLLKKGTTQIGDLNLKKLVEEIKTVDFEIFENGFLAGSGKKRSSSIYFVEQKKVIINSLALKFLAQEFFGPLALHEALGALGYYDENYEISLGLFLLLMPDNLGLKEILVQSSLFKDLKRRTSEPLYANGGATSIGGGGDGLTMEAKTGWLIQTLAKTSSSRRSEVVHHILRSTVELGTAMDMQIGTESSAVEFEMVSFLNNKKAVVNSITEYFLKNKFK